MQVPYATIIEVGYRWISTVRSELHDLGVDIASVVAAIQDQWANDKEFRSRVISDVIDGLSAAVLRGPRAAVLWAIHAVAEVIAFIANVLDNCGPDLGYVR
jgi:hypothetical protein